VRLLHGVFYSVKLPYTDPAPIVDLGVSGKLNTWDDEPSKNLEKISLINDRYRTDKRKTSMWFYWHS
jgi:hypothetical protein